MCSVKPQSDLSHKGHAVEEWADLHFFRPIGIRIARALQPTGISADQVTLWSLVIGLVAGHLFAYQDRWTNVIGFALFIVSDIFDSADGQLARLRGTSTRMGRVLDGLADTGRVVRLYGHLGARLFVSGWGWGGAVLAFAALAAHSYQAAAVDFIRQAYLHFAVGKGSELDIPDQSATFSDHSLFTRISSWIYVDYIRRQALLFPRTTALVRTLAGGAGGAGGPRGGRDVPASLRRAWAERQRWCLSGWAWIAPIIRVLLLSSNVEPRET